VNRKGEEVYMGKTPATATLKASAKYMSGERYTVTISKDGFEDHVVYIDSKIEGWYWGNILLGGLVGMLVVDPLTGAMYRLNTKTVDVSLEKDADSAELRVVDINALPDNMKKDLVKLN